MSIGTVSAHTWKATPPNIMIEPMAIAGRRPSPSEAKGVNGIPYPKVRFAIGGAKATRHLQEMNR